MHARALLDANPALPEAAGETVRLAWNALDDLRKLDDTLYEQFVDNRSLAQAPGALGANLRLVWSATFHALEELLAYYRGLVARRAPGPAVAEAPPDDFDLGELAPADEPPFDLEAGDIGGLVESLGDGPAQESESVRWERALDAMSGIEYGLTSQYREASERFELVLAAGQLPSALAVIEDMASSANEAIHALVSAICEALLPDVDRNTIVPEYVTTLTRALRVRRGVAQLAAGLGRHNARLQSADASAHQPALEAIRALVHDFVASDEWRLMRAADRWELAQFDRQLRDQPARDATLTAEGLAKYVESLGAINQREVLIRHDQQILGELRETLSSARELMDISPTTTHQLLLQACRSADHLRGRNPELDDLLDHELPPSPSTATLLDRLARLVSAAR